MTEVEGEALGFLGILVVIFVIIWMAVIAKRIKDIRDSIKQIRDDARIGTKWLEYLGGNQTKRN